MAISTASALLRPDAPPQLHPVAVAHLDTSTPCSIDQIMRAPDRPDRLRPDLDSGDGLHPSLRGYVVMGDAVPLTHFTAEPPPGS